VQTLEEPTFKVGAWIRFSTTKQLLGRVAGFSSANVPYIVSGEDKITPSTLELELWAPKPNEWCWLYGKLIKITDISSIEYCQYITSVGDNNEASYEYLQSNCEPFIGILPTFLKDKQ
jgi:hypothetical protein